MAQTVVDEVMLREPRLLVPLLAPIGRVQIDRQHPLAAGCVFCWCGSRVAVDSRYNGALSAGAAFVPTTRNGMALRGTATATEKPLNFGTVSPLQVGTGDFTILLDGSAVAEDSISYAISQRLGSGSYAQVTLTFNSNATPVAASGYFNFQTYNTAYSNVAAAGVVDGLPHVYVCRRLGQDHSIWVDGISKASATLTVRNITAASQGFCLGAAALVDASALKTTGRINSAMMWSRSLSDEEIASVSRDPYQFLIPA